MTVRDEVRRTTQVKLFGLKQAELEVIARKYCLEIKQHTGDAWVSFEIPEAKTEIVWFRGHDWEA